MLIAKKYYLFHALDRKKAGLKWVRIAKKIDSSLCGVAMNLEQRFKVSPYSIVGIVAP